MCKWIPIKHSFVCGVDAIVSDLPKDGEIVFITLRGGKVGYDVFERVPNDRWKFKHFDIKDVEAWMKLPHEPFEPGRCDDCTHGEQGIDNFGDHWSKCKLLDDVPFSQIIRLKGCPLDCHRERR